jgi:hypothetical protein
MYRGLGYIHDLGELLHNSLIQSVLLSGDKQNQIGGTRKSSIRALSLNHFIGELGHYPCC